jgi:hypothetical protein
MIDLSLPLIGPAVQTLAFLQALLKRKPTLAALLHGTPGSGKSHLLDKLALELVGAGSERNGVGACGGMERREHPAIEHVNGQSLTVDIVRDWREKSCYGNLFSKWTIKRVDEFDKASPAARAEVLTLLDYLKPHQLILATTNDYAALRGDGNRRLESRFKCAEVNGPSAQEASAYLVTRFDIPAGIAHEIAESAVPDGELFSPGVNMRLCVEYAESWLAAREVQIAA